MIYAVPSSYLILIQGTKILLIRRFNTGYGDGQYSLPAGHVEKRETLRQTMVREAREEIGILLDVYNLQVVHLMQRTSQIYPENNNNRLDVFFKASDWLGNIYNAEPDKCDDLFWCEVSDLPKNTLPYIRHGIKCILKGVFYSEYDVSLAACKRED